MRQLHLQEVIQLKIVKAKSINVHFVNTIPVKNCMNGDQIKLYRMKIISFPRICIFGLVDFH